CRIRSPAVRLPVGPGPSDGDDGSTGRRAVAQRALLPALRPRRDPARKRGRPAVGSLPGRGALFGPCRPDLEPLNGARNEVTTLGVRFPARPLDRVPPRRADVDDARSARLLVTVALGRDDPAPTRGDGVARADRGNSGSV